MLDIKFVRDNPEIVKENIRKKFQEEKLPLVDEVITLYAQALEAKQKAETLQANRNTLSKQIGMLKGQAKKNPPWPRKTKRRLRRLPPRSMPRALSGRVCWLSRRSWTPRCGRSCW